MNYVVKPGDTLSLIASRLLGPSGSWSDMIRFNPEIENPDMIYAGQSLYIPDNSLYLASKEDGQVNSTEVLPSISISPTMLIYVAAAAIFLYGLLANKNKIQKV